MNSLLPNAARLSSDRSYNATRTRLQKHGRYHYIPDAPSTVEDLTDAAEFVSKQFEFFKNSDGKLNPGKYGSQPSKDFGLCYDTFWTGYQCAYGQACPWRHEALNAKEEAFIASLGFQKALDRFKDCRSRAQQKKSAWDLCVEYESS